MDADNDQTTFNRIWQLFWMLIIFATAPLAQAQSNPVATRHRLAINASHFTLDDRPFPYTGVSFFNAIYNPAFNASAEARLKWLRKFQGYGINVLRVWCQWDSGLGFVDASPQSTLYDADGALRPAPLATLKSILADADQLGMCLEIVIFSQESFLQKIHLAAPADERAVAALTRELAPFRNAAFQIWNHITRQIFGLAGL